MKVNVNGMDMEMSVEEFKVISEIFGTKPNIKELVKNLSFDEELDLIHSLKYFKADDMELSSWGTMKVTLRSDLS